MEGAGGDRRVSGGDDAGPHRRGAALAELHRALKALGFYPEGHPRRADSLHRACQFLRTAMGEGELVLVIGRAGFISAEGGAAVDANPMAQALARELFIRRVRRLTILPDLTPADLDAFLLLLTLDHRAVPAAGGMEELMERRGITTIWANELDLSVILHKRQAMALAAAGAVTGAYAELARPFPEEEPEAVSPVEGLLAVTEEIPFARAEAEDNEVEALLARMEREPDDERFRELARRLVRECESLMAREECERLLPVVGGLLRQGTDEGQSLVRRGYALLAFEQAAGGTMAEFLAQRVEERGGEERDFLHAIFRELGPRAVGPLVERLSLAQSLVARKNLAAALVAVGEEAVNLLAAKLRDERWYVVRNVAAILGEIGYGGSVGELRESLRHPDGRVRREALRSLAAIGGPEAGEALVALVADRDPAVRRQVVVSLGILRSARGVEPLCAILAERDLFLRSLALKREAVLALGRIGDRRAVPCLMELLGGRHWFARRRREDLGIAAAAALGQLGDPAALETLEILAARRGRLGAACGDAVEAIRRLAEDGHD